MSLSDHTFEFSQLFTERDNIQVLCDSLRHYIDDRLRNPQNLSVEERQRRAFLLGVVMMGEGALADCDRTPSSSSLVLDVRVEPIDETLEVPMWDTLPLPEVPVLDTSVTEIPVEKTETPTSATAPTPTPVLKRPRPTRRPKGT